MSENRRPVYLDYYTTDDYEDVLTKLPGLIQEAERKAGEVLEPTFKEKQEIMRFI